MDRNIHRLVTVGIRAATLSSILLMLPGCLSVAPRVSPASDTVPTVGGPVLEVKVLRVSDPEVKIAPDPVSDSEVSSAQAALREASAWGAKYYKPLMYAKAQSTLNEAIAARFRDPPRCRSLLSEATGAASAAKTAALLAYQDDVLSRFQASSAQLMAIGADRAFPDEFTGLISGIDATEVLFAAGSYWDARIKAYTTLKGMSDLYERVRSLKEWLQGERVRVGKSLGAARALDAAAWAPDEMKDAEHKYQDALTEMQVGDLTAAVSSMRAAGLIAVRLPLLRDQMEKREASLPPPRKQEAPRRDTGARDPRAGSQLLPVDSIPSGQRVRIAQMSMSSLGSPQKLYTTFSAAVARFDVVAAEGLRDAGIMEKVLAGLDESWEAAVSRSGYFGFIYDSRIQMVKDLGTYPGKGEFQRTPYAAQFRLVGTRFRVNLVLCHIEPDQDRKVATAEIARLAKVHRYYEDLTGNRGITLLLAGGLGGALGQASESVVPRGEMVPLQATLAAALRPTDHGQRMFASAPLQPLVETSGFGASTPSVAYVTLGGGK